MQDLFEQGYGFPHFGEDINTSCMQKLGTVVHMDLNSSLQFGWLDLAHGFADMLASLHLCSRGSVVALACMPCVAGAWCSCQEPCVRMCQLHVHWLWCEEVALAETDSRREV